MKDRILARETGRCIENRHITVSTLFMTLGKLCVRSTHGLISTAPAGCSKPMSRSTVMRDKASAAPALSPARIILDGGIGL